MVSKFVFPLIEGSFLKSLASLRFLSLRILLLEVSLLTALSRNGHTTDIFRFVISWENTSIRTITVI